jgi:hypothetical protein
MFNVENSFQTRQKYKGERDLYIKGFLYSFSIVLFVEGLRQQVPEVNILQLIPGFYLLLLFLGFLFFMFVSTIFYEAVIKQDTKKLTGIKVKLKPVGSVLNKLSFFLFTGELNLILQTVVPLSLECFNSYGDETLENTWSFNEVIGLEILIMTILLVISQFPFIILQFLTTQQPIKLLPLYWKPVFFFIVLSSGFLTPTIDGYTQISFAFSTLSLYLLLINFSQKRLILKDPTFDLMH